MEKSDAERLFEAKQAYDSAKDLYESLRDKAIADLTPLRKGAEKESVKVTVGRVVINVAYNDGVVSVAWEKVLERVKNMFPKVSAVLGNIMRGTYENEKGEKVPYVKPSPRATLKVDVTE